MESTPDTIQPDANTIPVGQEEPDVPDADGNEKGEGDTRVSSANTSRAQSPLKYREGDQSGPNTQLSKSFYSRSPTRDLSSPPSQEEIADEDESKDGSVPLKTDIDSDSGWDTDLEIEDDIKDDFDSTGRSTYIESCKEYGIVPVSYFLRHIQDYKIRMKHHGLGPLGTKAIAITLVTNTVVVSLDLEDNCIEGLGGKYVADMLKENCYITELNLAYNKLGSLGATAIGSMLESNTILRRVNLSGNGFADKDAEPFTHALKSNYRLKELILSDNKFSEVGGEFLGEAIASNDTIELLDLSWNHLRRRGAIAICKAMSENNSIRTLNLSWNGFGNEGALAMGQALKFNKQLVDLDLTNNRITNEGALSISKGLEQNDTLKVLRIGKNPITAAGALTLLMAIKNNPQSAIMDIRLTDILITIEFEDILKEILEMKPDLKIEHGGTGGYSKHNREVKKVIVDPMAHLLDYVQKNNLRLLDLFQRFDKDKSMSVSKEEFKRGIQSTNIPLSESQLDDLINSLDKDRDGEIDYSKLIKMTENLLEEVSPDTDQ
ncbi:leucine-rich repeat-containing protein 74A-like isoform X2 [Ptychodera flava]|uniref:leucine-rich repeat-containing protein 74A-like isoform X2 n=1 Tax=Ptychodera flava TaxID=63121 RepID=UPI00396A7972